MSEITIVIESYEADVVLKAIKDYKRSTASIAERYSITDRERRDIEIENNILERVEAAIEKAQL